jgi:hypothetical protein
MTCGEFQKVLPFIFESGGDPTQQQHLQECKICSDLVADLQYIVDQAKLLVPMEEPSPRVWDGIQKSLQQDGIMRQSGTRLAHRTVPRA